MKKLMLLVIVAISSTGCASAPRAAGAFLSGFGQGLASQNGQGPVNCTSYSYGSMTQIRCE